MNFCVVNLYCLCKNDFPLKVFWLRYTSSDIHLSTQLPVWRLPGLYSDFFFFDELLCHTLLMVTRLRSPDLFHNNFSWWHCIFWYFIRATIIEFNELCYSHRGNKNPPVYLESHQISKCMSVCFFCFFLKAAVYGSQRQHLCKINLANCNTGY